MITLGEILTVSEAEVKLEPTISEAVVNWDPGLSEVDVQSF